MKVAKSNCNSLLTSPLLLSGQYIHFHLVTIIYTIILFLQRINIIFYLFLIDHQKESLIT